MPVHPRSVMLVHKQVYLLKREDLWGIEIFKADEEDNFNWEVKLSGPKGTEWEGGIFRVAISYPVDYNYSPPEVKFMTIPFHPNVDINTGKPCIDFLDDPELWHEEISLLTLLLSLQLLLADPVLIQPVNEAAANIYLNTPHMYGQIVRDCVLASRRVEAGLPALISEGERDEEEGKNIEAGVVANKGEESAKGGDVKSMNSVENNRSSRGEGGTIPAQSGKGGRSSVGGTMQAVSYEEYLMSWKGMATSKSAVGDLNTKQFHRLLQANPSQLQVHTRVSQEKLIQLINHHKMLYYGKFTLTYQDKEEIQDIRRKRINLLRHIYGFSNSKEDLSGRTGADDPRIRASKDHKFGKQGTGKKKPKAIKNMDAWESEVDELVAWSSQLDVGDDLAFAI
eukprot:Nk52_evm4s696 gene=Nk52_evmTU4s696